MLITVGEFCGRVEDDLNGFVDELQSRTGRSTESERASWQKSLGRLSVALADDRLKRFHIHLNDSRGSLIVEYRLPASSSWCDVVLLGNTGKRPSAVIVELKHWMTDGDRPGPTPGTAPHLRKAPLPANPSRPQSRRGSRSKEAGRHCTRTSSVRSSQSGS